MFGRMGSAYSITYTFNQTDFASGDFQTHEHSTTLYYCGLVTWQDRPCDDDVFNGVWTVLIGFMSIFLLVVVSAWACTPLPSERRSYYPPSDQHRHRRETTTIIYPDGHRMITPHQYNGQNYMYPQPVPVVPSHGGPVTHQGY